MSDEITGGTGMAATNGDYTDQAMVHHRKTYHGFLRLLKVGIGVVICVLIILMIIYAV